MDKQPEYKRRLEKLPPKLREAWLNGSWDIYEGQFFEEFRDDPRHYKDRVYTHVIDPFEVPDGWKIYRSFDWGYNKPFSCGWWAVDYDGVLYRILELYGCTDTPNEGFKWPPEQVFAEIHRIEVEHRWLAGKKIIGIADPAIWRRNTVCTFLRGTTSGFPAGCRYTTGCTLTKTVSRRCIFSKTAGRLSGQSPC